jgi:hypothetical protein
MPAYTAAPVLAADGHIDELTPIVHWDRRGLAVVPSGNTPLTPPLIR